MDTHEDERSPQYRDDHIAYEVWVWKAQRSHLKTAQILAELGLGHITRKKIEHWARKQSWGLRADSDIKKLAPSIHNETVGGLIIAGLKAQRIMDQLLEDWAEKRISPDREVVKLLDVTLKYAGMSPNGTRDPTESARLPVGAASTIVERYLTPEEIAKIAEDDDEPLILTETSGIALDD